MKADAAPVRTVSKGSRHPTLLRIRAEDFHRHKVLNACRSHIYDIDAYVYLGLSTFPSKVASNAGARPLEKSS